MDLTPGLDDMQTILATRKRSRIDRGQNRIKIAFISQARTANRGNLPSSRVGVWRNIFVRQAERQFACGFGNLIYVKRIESSCKYDLSGQFAAETIDLVATSQDF